MEEISFWDEYRTVIYAVCFVVLIALFYLIFIDPSIITKFILERQHAEVEAYAKNIFSATPTPKESWLTKPLI